MTRRATANLTNLRSKLLNLFDEVHSGAIDTKVAKELNNTAGKIMTSVSIQLKAQELSVTSEQIPFIK